MERAKLDYSAKEVLSRVEAEQRGLAVDDADQKVKEASAKLGSDRVGATAKQAARLCPPVIEIREPRALQPVRRRRISCGR